MCAVVGTLYGCEIHIISNDGSTLIVKGIDIEIVDSLGEAVEESISEYTAYEELVGSLNSHKSNSSNPHNVISAQVNALPDTTKYEYALETNKTSLVLKDQDGTVLSSVTTQDTTYTGGTNVTISSSNVISAIDTTYSLASATTDGLMSSNDKTKLDGIQIGAEVNVQSDWNQTNSDSDDYIKNKPNIPSALSDLPGTLPIEKGGTGGTTVSEAPSALKIYTNITQLGLEYPCTTGDIVYAMPSGSIGFFNVEASASTVTDVATGFSFLEIYKSTGSRVRVLLNGAPVDGSSTSTTFNIGHYNSSTHTIDAWKRIQTSGFATPVNCGGTGATNATDALNNLGAQAATDSTLNTTNKTIVGAINELYQLIKSL